MVRSTLFFAAAFFAAFSQASVAGEAIEVHDPYIRLSRPEAPTGAAFMKIENLGGKDDRLIAVTSDAAAMVELHTHISDDDGVMRMRAIEGGIPLVAGESYEMKRGGDHVMFMGLNRALENGDEVTLTLTFESAGDMNVVLVVDNDRMTHSGH